jgi:hypothetical protein
MGIVTGYILREKLIGTSLEKFYEDYKVRAIVVDSYMIGQFRFYKIEVLYTDPVGDRRVLGSWYGKAKSREHAKSIGTAKLVEKHMKTILGG